MDTNHSNICDDIGDNSNEVDEKVARIRWIEEMIKTKQEARKEYELSRKASRR
jgi:hypothetical protein